MKSNRIEKKGRPAEWRKIGGEDVEILNPNWEKHLDQAYQCNWQVNSTSPKYEITYGTTPEEAMKRMKERIAQYEPRP